MPDGRIADHQRARRVGRSSHEPQHRRRGVHALGGPERRGTISLVGTRGGAGQPPEGGNYPHMFSMPSGPHARRRPLPGRQLVPEPARGRELLSRGSDAPDLPRDRLWGTAVLMPGGPGGSTRVMGSAAAHRRHTSTTTDSRSQHRGLRRGSAHRGLAAGAGDEGRRAGTTTPCCCPTARWSRSAAASGIRERRPVGRADRGAEAGRAVGSRRPAAGASGRRRPRTAPTTRPRCCCPTDAWSPRATTCNGGIDRDTAEIYEPPYLFKGARPTISSAPGHGPDRHALRRGHAERERHRRRALIAPAR